MSLPQRFLDKITLADVVSLGSAAIVGLYVVFQHGAAIDALAQEDAHMRKDIEEVKETHQRDKDTIYIEIKDQRKEAKEQYEKLDGKLDKVIDHLIEEN